MLKLLLVIGVIAFIYYFFIKKPTLKNPKKDNVKLEANDMVECSACGIYCEFNEAILSHGKYYCSTECVEKA